MKKVFFPIATSLRHALPHYKLDTFRHDVVAGLIVALVALPLSMALAIAVGLPPVHGLHTAIVAGAVAGLLGGSAFQVSGPTAAFVVIIAPIVGQFGLSGLIWCQVIAGVILLIFGLARVGKIIRFVPHSVVVGFTAGIAVTISVIAIGDFLGLGKMPFLHSFADKISFIGEHLVYMKAADLFVGIVTLLAILLLPRLSQKIPSSAVGIVLGTCAALILSKLGLPVETLNTRFSYMGTEGILHPGIAPYPPALHVPDNLPSYDDVKTLFIPALTIAALAALESLLSATVADSMTRTKHDPDSELSGIGVANIFTGLAGGIPATGAIARTAANIHSGAKTSLAAIFHALFILFFMMNLAPWISEIPMAALAALLLAVAFRMAHAAEFLHIVRFAPRGDVIVLITTFILTVFIDMVAGVVFGMVAATLLFMKNISDSTYVGKASAETDAVRPVLPKGVVIYRVEGPLFFGTVDKMLEGAETISPNVKKLIINMAHVPVIDLSGMNGIKAFLLSVSREGLDIVICGKKHILAHIRSKISGMRSLNHVRFGNSVSDELK